MMLLIALALAVAPAIAGDSPPPPQMQQLLQNCDAHKFETIIEVTVDGQLKHSRVKLCGTEGQSDADWVRTLKDAVAKTEANLQMPPAVRTQIVTALNSEIARLAKGTGVALPPPRPSAKTTALDGFSALPPLPEPKPAETAAALPPPRMIAVTPVSRDYSALPPMPTAPTAPTRVLTGSVGASLPALPRPRMQFICYTPGETGEVPCADFTRDTLLTVRADEDLPAGTSLRFVLGGNARADVELAQLRKGKTERLALPPQVCSHIGGGTLEIRIVRSVPAAGPDGQEVGKDGPYDLRC
jgi:hypothetical protein